MIQIYKPTNTDFTKNGDMVLFAESCEVHAKLNGEWYLDIEHPLDEEGRWKEIAEEAVISVPTFMGNNQLFRIDDVEVTDTEIKAKAYPIFFDSADELFVYSCRPAFVNGQVALNMLMGGTKYSGESNITRTSSAEFINRNLMDCLNGDNDPAFLRYWGGDILYDNYKVIINERAGSNQGFEIRYRKNMDGISRKVDMSNIVTRIVPVAYNGRGLSTKYVDSPNINKYAKVYTRLVEFSDIKLKEDASEEESEDITVCANQLALDAAIKARCKEMFDEGIDLPNITLNVDLVDLSRTEEYKEFAGLEKVSLGDTVGVYHPDLGISTEERVIEITWDCINDSVKKLTLGDYEYNYLIDGNKELRDKIREQYKQAAEEWKKKWEELQKECEETYETKEDAEASQEEMEEYVNTHVEAEIQKAEESITLYVSETYENKADAEESYKNIQASIELTASSIESRVSETYETKTDAEESYKSLESSITQTATSIESRVSETYETKSNAQENYTSFESSITQLSNRITSVVSETDSLGTRMTIVEQTATDFSVRLDDIEGNVEEWQETADKTIELATNANVTAMGAETTAKDAYSAATNANVQAMGAETTANNAMSSANSAKAQADSAKVTAMGAETTANNAHGVATSAKAQAEQAEKEAEEASKTATNYLKFGDTGLIVGDVSGNTLYSNILISSTAMNIRYGGTVLASFDQSNIELGKNSDSAKINLCNGLASFYKYGSDSNLGINTTKGISFLINKVEKYKFTSGTAYLYSALNVRDGATISGALSVGGDVTLSGKVVGALKVGGYIYMGSGNSYSADRGLSTPYRDGSDHSIVYRASDGLTSYFGWAGSSSHASVGVLRGQTVKYTNSNGTTTLSDVRMKKDFTTLDQWEGFFDSLEPCAFKMKNGVSGRYHVGFKAQQVEQALTDNGLTTQDFAGFIRMPYNPDPEDPEGSAVYKEAGIEAGADELGLIYSEFIAMNTWQIQQIKKEVEKLKSQLVA